MGIGTKLINLMVKIAIEYDYQNLEKCEVEKILLKHEHARKFIKGLSGDITELKRKENEAEAQIHLIEEIVNSLTLELYGTPRNSEEDDFDFTDETICSKFCLALKFNRAPLRCTTHDWIQCTKCTSWFHSLCIGLNVKATKLSAKSSNFLCPPCNKLVIYNELLIEAVQEEMGLWKCEQNRFLSEIANSVARISTEIDNLNIHGSVLGGLKFLTC